MQIRPFILLVSSISLFALSACAGSPSQPASLEATSAPAALAEATTAPPTSEPTTNQETVAPEATAADTDASSDQELIVIGNEIAASLDPVAELTSSYLRNMGAAEALFRVAADGQVVPSLAESIEQIDPTTWEIKLRPNVSFWSGAIVDAAAVQASLERSRTLDKQAEPFLQGFTLSELDPTTLQVTTEQPNQPVALNLSYYQLVIHNAASYGAEVNGFDLESADLTGMYRISEFVPKQYMLLEQNPSYWGEQPSIMRVRHEEVSDPQARVLAAQSGQAHVVMNMPASSVSQLAGSEQSSLVTVPAPTTQTIYLNSQAPALQDLRVRQALAWGTDRAELVELVTEGQSSPITSWLASNPAFAEAQQIVYTGYDASKAGELLDEAGWTLGNDGIRSHNGSPLQIRIMTWGDDKALGEVLQSQWSRLGVQAEVQHGDYSLIQTAREANDWEVSLEAWSTFGNPASLLSAQFAADGRANYGGFENADMTSLLEQLANASSDEERHTLALQVNQLATEQAPIIALYPRPQFTAVSTKLTGFEPHFRQFENIVKASLKIEP